MGGHVGRIAGALSLAEHREGLDLAGSTDVEVVPTHEATDRISAAIVRAREPGGRPAPPGARPAGGR